MQHSGGLRINFRRGRSSNCFYSSQSVITLPFCFNNLQIIIDVIPHVIITFQIVIFVVPPTEYGLKEVNGRTRGFIGFILGRER